MASDAPASTGPGFSERLWVPPWWWAVAALTIAVLGAEVHLGLGQVVAVVTYGVLGLVGAALLVRWSAPVRVESGQLRAGSHRVPLARITDVQVINRADTRGLLAARPDASAVVLLRGYVRYAAYIATDGRDGAPGYLLVSTRRPTELAATLPTREGSTHRPS